MQIILLRCLFLSLSAKSKYSIYNRKSQPKPENVEQQICRHYVGSSAGWSGFVYKQNVYILLTYQQQTTCLVKIWL